MVYRQALKDATENKTEEETTEQQQDDDEQKPFRVTNNLNVVKTHWDMEKGNLFFQF